MTNDAGPDGTADENKAPNIHDGRFEKIRHIHIRLQRNMEFRKRLHSLSKEETR